LAGYENPAVLIDSLNKMLKGETLSAIPNQMEKLAVEGTKFLKGFERPYTPSKQKALLGLITSAGGNALKIF
jgi:hypothetical protein